MPCISLVIFLSNQSVERVRHNRQNSAYNEVICLFFFLPKNVSLQYQLFPSLSTGIIIVVEKKTFLGNIVFSKTKIGGIVFFKNENCAGAEGEEMLAWLPNKRERKCWHDYQTREKGNVGMTTKQEREEMLAWLPNKRERKCWHDYQTRENMFTRLE